MYTNGYNMYQNRRNILGVNRRMPQYHQDRFISGGFVAPFILGGIAGGLVANNYRPPYRPNTPNWQTGYMPYPTYYNNFYYPPYGPVFYR